MTENKTKGNELSLLFISLRHSFALLGKNDPMRMAGATAFFYHVRITADRFLYCRSYLVYSRVGVKWAAA
jgi:hypothetical protein